LKVESRKKGAAENGRWRDGEKGRKGEKIKAMNNE